MTVKAVNEKGDFFNYEQKEIKGKIMDSLLMQLDAYIVPNRHLFQGQAFVDLLCSILIMFNREVLINMLSYSGAINHRKEIMNTMFNEIKNQVNEKIKKEFFEKMN